MILTKKNTNSAINFFSIFLWHKVHNFSTINHEVRKFYIHIDSIPVSRLLSQLAICHSPTKGKKEPKMFDSETRKWTSLEANFTWALKENRHKRADINRSTFLTFTKCGAYEEWPDFRDIFTAAYINHQLSRAQKLYHLLDLVRIMIWCLSI